MRFHQDSVLYKYNLKIAIKIVGPFFILVHSCSKFCFYQRWAYRLQYKMYIILLKTFLQHKLSYMITMPMLNVQFVYKKNQIINSYSTVKYIYIRENRRGNQEWTIQSYWQHWVHKTKDKDKQNKKTFHRNLKR